MATKSPKLDLVARDLADADAHLVEALALVNGRVPGWFTDRLISLSDHLWQQRRFDCDADDALAHLDEAAELTAGRTTRSFAENLSELRHQLRNFTVAPAPAALDGYDTDALVEKTIGHIIAGAPAAQITRELNEIAAVIEARDARVAS